MNKMFLAALLAISGGSIATADTLLGRVADSEGNPVEFATVVALSTQGRRIKIIRIKLQYFKL